MPSMPTGLNISSNEEELEILCLKLLRLRWKRPRIQQHGEPLGSELRHVGQKSACESRECFRHDAFYGSACSEGLSSYRGYGTLVLPSENRVSVS
jgi:hypothetical protein